MTATADVLEPILKQRFSQTYAGLELDHARHTVIVWRLPDPALDAEMRANAPGAKLEFKDARIPIAQNGTLAAQILTDQKTWANQGIEITTASAAGSTVQVGVKKVTATTKKTLAQHYGSWAIDVRQT